MAPAKRQCIAILIRSIFIDLESSTQSFMNYMQLVIKHARCFRHALGPFSRYICFLRHWIPAGACTGPLFKNATHRSAVTRQPWRQEARHRLGSWQCVQLLQPLWKLLEGHLEP